MKLVLFQTSGRQEPIPGLLTERGVVDISSVTEKGHTPQLTMQALIEGFERLRPALERHAAEGKALPLNSVRLRAPLPRPARSSAASPITGSMRSARRAHSICS